MTELIERAYLEATGLKYRFFGLSLERILNLKIESINANNYETFTNAFDAGITVDCTIECDTYACQVLQDSEFRDRFEALGTRKLREYFDTYVSELVETVNADENEEEGSELIFMTARYDDYAVLYPSAPTTFVGSLRENTILLALFCVLWCAVLIALLALRYGKKHEMDCLWFGPIVYAVQLAMFVANINLCSAILKNEEFGTDVRVQICGIGSIVCLAIPYSVNTYYGGRIRRITPTENENAIAFFKHKKAFFMFLVWSCGGCYPAIVLLSSNLFGLAQFNSGLTNSELLKLNRVKLWSTCVLQNIPQIMVQCVYAAVIREMSPNITFALICSIFSLGSFKPEEAKERLTGSDREKLQTLVSNYFKDSVQKAFCTDEDF